ncbi:MAG: hypothetical protein Q8M24_16460 [Pseudolabrys sp.]|nr:hypothetical protein [Pseudolabrys sp.]MDP2297037.1 hypothetical protein [Pseudolabrys sp.]
MLGIVDCDERSTAIFQAWHRVLVNLAAFVVVILLITAGYWLADTMPRMRKDQDCVLSGRRNCTPVAIDIPQNRS